jgi:hypothetical protein
MMAAVGKTKVRIKTMAAIPAGEAIVAGQCATAGIG